MFEALSDRLSSSLKAISGKSKLTEDNIRDTLRDVRMALLEADVALPVVKSFTDRVKDRAVGVEVSKSLTPGQSFLKVVLYQREPPPSQRPWALKVGLPMSGMAL